MLIKSGLLTRCSPAPQRLRKVKAKPERQPHLIWDWRVCGSRSPVHPAPGASPTLGSQEEAWPSDGRGSGGPGVRGSGGLGVRDSGRGVGVGARCRLLCWTVFCQHSGRATGMPQLEWIYPGLLRGSHRAEVALSTPPLLEAPPEFSEHPSLSWVSCSLSPPSPAITCQLSIRLPPWALLLSRSDTSLMHLHTLTQGSVVVWTASLSG